MRSRTLLLVALCAIPSVPLAFSAGPVTPGDPLWADQWGPAAVGLPEAWALTRGSHAVKIAIIDTGVEYSHPDLAPNLQTSDPACGPDATFVPPHRGQDPERWGQPDDDSEHGTHVAGIAAAAMDNGQGIAGASQSCLMILKIGVRFNGPIALIPPELAGMAIDHASANGADVISMSFGSIPDGDPLVEAAIERAWERGAVLVAATGNSGCVGLLGIGDGNRVNYPATSPFVIAVANLATPSEVSRDSSCGPKVELAAPGSLILSTVRNGAYGERSGTSMATPLVAGIVALMKDYNPSITNAQIRCVLRETAFDLGEPGRDIRSGFGRVDAARAVGAARDPGSVSC